MTCARNGIKQYQGQRPSRINAGQPSRGRHPLVLGTDVQYSALVALQVAVLGADRAGRCSARAIGAARGVCL